MSQNKFLSNNINFAILLSQYDMRGYKHAMGRRMIGISSKGLSFVPFGLISLAAGYHEKSGEAQEQRGTIDPEIMIDGDENIPYEKVLHLCKKFASECDDYQKEAIQFLLKDVLNKTDELKNLLGQGKDAYIRPLDKNSNWGKIMLGLMETFEVEAEKPVQIKTIP